jgi:hypothetical protein
MLHMPAYAQGRCAPRLAHAPVGVRPCWAHEKKPSRLWRKGLISLEFLAPRPGLEPGTYGLTVPHKNNSRVLNIV